MVSSQWSVTSLVREGLVVVRPLRAEISLRGKSGRRVGGVQGEY